MMKRISFVVLNYNDADTTITLVDSLCEWKMDKENFHVVIVDNKSKDDSYNKLSKRYKLCANVDVILAEKNGGYSYGNNLGARFAIEKYDSEYIAIANPDIQIDQMTLLKLLDTFEVDETIAMVAPVMKDINGNYTIHSQKLPTFMDDLRACFNSAKSKTLSTENVQYIDSERSMLVTQMLPGSFFVVRANYLEKVGMFDENVFLFCEERIIGKKMADRGYKSILRSDLFFLHAHSTSIKKVYDIVGTWKLIMLSRLYYQRTYNNISQAQEMILKICMKLFLIGLQTKMIIYKMVKGKLNSHA